MLNNRVERCEKKLVFKEKNEGEKPTKKTNPLNFLNRKNNAKKRVRKGGKEKEKEKFTYSLKEVEKENQSTLTQ